MGIPWDNGRKITFDQAYELATWICNNKSDEVLFRIKFENEWPQPTLKAIYRCVNSQKDMINIERLRREFTN